MMSDLTRCTICSLNISPYQPASRRHRAPACSEAEHVEQEEQKRLSVFGVVLDRDIFFLIPYL
jgi:hypothetical protein